MIDNISLVVLYLLVDCSCRNHVPDLTLVVIEIMSKCFRSDVTVAYWNAQLNVLVFFVLE